MQASNGQISSRDIRQKAIHATHVRDSAILTAAIADVAVTTEKLEDPPWSFGQQAPNVADLSLTTTYTEGASLTIDIPAWVGILTILAIGRLQATNNSGGTQRFLCSTRLNGLDSGASSINIVDTLHAATIHTEVSSCPHRARASSSPLMPESLRASTTPTGHRCTSSPSAPGE
jgi:hypothetical protein